MTGRNAKAVLFTLLTVAIIFPAVLTYANTPSTEDVAEAEIKELGKVMDPYIAAKQQLSKYQNQLDDAIATDIGEGTADIKSQIQKLKDDIKRHEARLAVMEQESIEKYKIEPELEAKLHDAQREIVNSGLPIASVSVSGLHKALVVTIDKTQLTAENDESYYEQLIRNKYLDLPLLVRFGAVQPDGCATLKSNCNPLLGGIQIEAKNKNKCSIGLPIDRNGTKGFITAAHCANNTPGSGDDVFQPTEDLLGWNKIGDVSVRVFDTTCDCAWVEQSSSDTNISAVWSNVHVGTDITTYVDRPARGTYIILHGATGGLAYGIVDNPHSTVSYDGVSFDVVSTTTDISKGGDSGGAYTNYAQNSFIGMHYASNDFKSFFGPWENIKAELEL